MTIFFHKKETNGLKHQLKDLPLSPTVLDLHSLCEIERTHSMLPQNIPRPIQNDCTWTETKRERERSWNSLSLVKCPSNEPSLFQQTTVQLAGGGAPFVDSKALRNLTVPELGNRDSWECAFFLEDPGMQYAQFTFFPQELFHSSWMPRERASKGPWHVNA